MKYRVFYKIVEHAYVDVDAKGKREARNKADEAIESGDGNRCGDAQWYFDEAVLEEEQ